LTLSLGFSRNTSKIPINTLFSTSTITRNLHLIAGALFVCLAVLTVTQIGVVGEVAGSWSTPPPQVLIEDSPPAWADGAAPSTAGHRWGPLVASQVRPVSRLDLPGGPWPLAINMHTGGVADWPARLVHKLTGSQAAVVGLHVGLGLLLIGLCARFLHFHGTVGATAIVAFFLASDWSFLFYKKVLGGTEILLQAAVLLCLWALWSRRWGGGRHGLMAFAVGVGLGLLAKLTFLLSLAALLATALLTRFDKPAMGPPLPERWWRCAMPIVLLSAPLWVAWLHHCLAVGPEPHVVSHDFLGTQFRRVGQALSMGDTPAREGLTNLGRWATDPLAFFTVAYRAAPSPGPSPWRIVGWTLVLAGSLLAWRRRHATPQVALLRFMGIFVPMQLGLLLLVARDLHHLASAAPTVAIWAALALDQVAGQVAPSRSARRTLVGLVLALPWIWAGGQALVKTDALVRTIPIPTFTVQGQAALGKLIDSAGATRVVLCDYESMGALEILRPEVAFVHTWGLATRARADVLPAMLNQARGHHLLVVEASAPMIYNLHPSGTALQEAGLALGLAVTEAGQLPGGAATLYRVSSP
jgi:hypothetical protein